MSCVDILSRMPRAPEYCAALQEEENALQRYEVTAGDLKLLTDGTLEVHADSLDGRFPVSDSARPHEAKAAGIPERYYTDCDDELRVLSFNHRVRHPIRYGSPVQLGLRDDAVVSLLNGKLLPAPRAAILNTVLNAKPESVVAEEVRVVAHGPKETFDLSLFVPGWWREPRPGDLVAFGVSVREERDGPVQIHEAAYRCVCSNGAVRRTCDSRHHRLRRPLNHLDRQSLFLERVASFAREAWQPWQEHADALEELTQISIDPADRASLRSRLSQKPFFLPKRLIDQVIARLLIEVAQHQGMPSVFDLYNAMTYLGTHIERLSGTHRARLRLGAGELGRRTSRVCAACHQLILETARS